MSAIKLLSLLIIMTFLETANFIHVPTRTESVEHNGVLLALKYNKAANEYVSNLKDKPSSKSTSEAAWDFAQAAADYLNYTQNKDNLRKNDFLQNPNPLTNSKKLETVIEQTKIKGVAKPSNTVTIIVPAKNSESKSQYPSLNAIFNQNMAQYYLQKKHSKMAPVKADKEAKKVKAANKEKILLLKAKRPVSKAASFNKQAMMSTQREALKINNNLTPVLRLQMSNNHPQASQNHHQRVQTVHNPSTLSHQIKPLSANSPRMSSAPHFSQHQHHHQQKAHHQQQQQNPLQNSQRTLHSSQTHRPSSSQVAQTPVLSYSSAPYLAQTPQPLYYQPSRPVTNLWPNLFNVPHFNIGDILERSRPTKLKEKSETAEEKTKTLQAVTTQTGEDEEDEDEDEEDEDEIEENEDNNEEDEENVTDVDETATDEDEDDVEDDNEDTDDSFINQLSMQRPPLFAAAPRLANLYENEFEIPAPQNYQDFVPLRPSSQSHEDDIESARKRLHQIRQHIADLQKNNNPISVSSPNLVTGQLNRPFINQPGNENQRLVNVPKRLGSIHQLKLTKPITNEAEVEDEKEDEDKEQDSQEDKEEKVDDNENVDSEDENESKAEPEETSTNDQKENVDNEEELEKSDSQEDPKSSTSTDDSSKDEIESLNDELNKCLSEENDSSEISALDTCLDRIFSPEKETQESENKDKNKESESNDDVDE